MLTTHDMSPLSYKRQLAKRFDRASQSYDAYADFQKIILERLLSKLPMESADFVLDLGTGTGQALEQLANKLEPASCVALDLSQRMLEVASSQFFHLKNIHYVCTDAESLPLCSNVFDLIFSSLTIQWCLTPSNLFDELYRAIQPGGYVVFSTLLEGSMPEISNAWHGLDDQKHIHEYMDAESLLSCVRVGGFDLISSETSCVSMIFESPESAIHSLKKVGASLVSSSCDQSISPTKWKAFLRQYEGQRNESGIPLSYQVAFVVARKPFSCQE